MFKRANKITALLVAAASVMSVVPAMAANTTRLGTKDGTIEHAVAFDGKYIYEGYKGDADIAVYFNDGSKDKELTDYEDYTFTASTYGEKYILAEDGGDDYLVDLSTGNISDETLEDQYDSAASKLEKTLKKTDKYDGISISGGATGGDLTRVKSSASFQQPWYSYTTAGLADTTKNGNTIFTDGNGKYIDASVLANVYAYSTAKEKVVKVEKFGKTYSDSGLTATIVQQPKVIAQDKDYLYAVTNVKFVDSKADAAGTKDTYTVTTSAAVAVSVNGAAGTQNINDVYVEAQTAFGTNYDVTLKDGTVTLTAKTTGVKSALNITGGTINHVAGTAAVDGAGTKTTYAWYLQKISKAQGDTDEEAYEPKSVTSYQIDNKALYDNGDVNDAFGWLIDGDGTNDQQDGTVANFVNVEVKGNSLYAYKLEDSDTIKVFKLDLKQIKEYAIDKTVFGDNKLDGYVVKKDGDTDQDFDAYDVDSNGMLWVLNDGKIIKFAEKDKTTVYTCDSGLDQLDVYDEKNLIAWNEDDERYTTVSEGTAQTQSEAEVVAPPAPVTGWVKNADGTWSWNDYTGAKVASKWINVGGTWYYLKADGIMATGWYNDNGTWYYLNPASGAMSTSWLNDNGTWYYLNASGAMATGWVNVNGNWYYLSGSGAMLANTTVNGYRLGASGAWIQ